MAETDRWDPEDARRRAAQDLGGQDCSAAAEGLKEALMAQGWRLDSVRLWWQPGWSPDSFIQVMSVATWVGEGVAQPPILKAVVYDPEGRLAAIDDLSPYGTAGRRSIPSTMAFERKVHLIGSGPDTVPGRIQFLEGEPDFDFASYE